MNLIVINPGSRSRDPDLWRLAAEWIRLHGNVYLSADPPGILSPGVIVVELNNDHRPMLEYWLRGPAADTLEYAYRYAHSPDTGKKLPGKLIKQLRCIGAATLDKDTAVAVDFYLSLGAVDEPVRGPPKREPIRVKNPPDAARMYILGLTGESAQPKMGGEE